MPWLVVEGVGSWSPNLGREWVDDPTRFPPAHAPLDPETGNRKHGYWRDRAKIYRAGAHKVDEEVAKQAIATGFAWLIVMADEPELEQADPSFGPVGTLTPEDVREGKGAGVRVKPSEDEAPPPEPEAVGDPVFAHKCGWCKTDPPRSFPSPASLARHVEFEHPAQHTLGAERAAEAARLVAEEAEALRRVADHDKPMPAWEREAVEKAGLPAAPEPEPVIPEPAPPSR